MLCKYEDTECIGCDSECECMNDELWEQYWEDCCEEDDVFDYRDYL